MKVFLMFPDRDLHTEEPLAPWAGELEQDLGLDTVFNAMARGDEFLFKVVRQVLLSSLTDPQEILYRQAVLRDCLKNPGIVREIYGIAVQAVEGKRRLWLGRYGSFPSSILSGARSMLECYLEYLRELRRIAALYGDLFESQGFGRFFSMLKSELEEAYLDTIGRHLDMLKFRAGILVSAELGPGNEACNYVLRKPSQKDRSWVTRVASRWKSRVYSYSLHPRDDAGARALDEIRNKGISRVANAVAQSADHVEGFWKTLHRELAFYVGCLNLSEALSEMGEPTTFPVPAPAGARCMNAEGLYDVALALTMGERVVGNELVADGKDLVIITGANQGGKSTFLRSVGLAQLMMQSGMFVPAESFSGELCTRLFTHYKREEDPTMKSGKLDEELERMSGIVDALTGNSMVLFNESFGATNEHEGSEIAWGILNALLESRVRVFFVTHLYELARRFCQKGSPNVLFLRAQRQPDGKRTFKLLEGVPLPTSYGMDLYREIFEREKAVGLL